MAERSKSLSRLAWAGGLLLTAGAVAGVALDRPAEAQIAVRNQGYVPYSDAPINYRTRELHDQVAELEKELEAGKAHLTYEKDHGYLNSVLKLLKVPVDSQTLVFSKTSFQYPRITADHPRALYYNDDVYVGKVHDGKAIELVSFDARQGAIFYLVDERKVDKPVFQRAELDCTQCHIAAGTRGVPGVLLRSVFSTDTGTLVPGAPQYITDQNSPLSERWGGWYVDGGKATQSTTMASAIVTDVKAGAPAAATVDAAATGNGGPSAHKLAPLADQTYRSADYLIPNSDAVALLVLSHQTQAHNLITLTNYKNRIALYDLARKQASAAGDAPAGNVVPTALTTGARPVDLPEATRRQFEKPAEQLLRYFLFVDEAPLSGLDSQALINSPFAKEFAARGLRDSKGRSLRDFDLRTHIFKYPLSYLIYTDAYDAIPEPARSYVNHRLFQILTGADQDEDFAARLKPEDRRAVLEILLETKSGLPDEWKQYAQANHLKFIS